MPSTQDLVPPFDPTAYPEISGADLYQYITGAAPNTEIGFTLITDDVAGVPTVPDANITTKWKRYLWIRRGAVNIGAYVWNPAAASDATYLRWITINIAALGTGVIQGYMIADNTITADKIVSLDYTQLTGVPATFLPGGDAGGDLDGTYPNPVIAPAAVTGAKIAAATITHDNIAPEAIEPVTDIEPNAVGKTVLRTNAGATAMEFAVIKITELANPASAADVGKTVVVANPYTDGFTLSAAANSYTIYRSPVPVAVATGLMVNTAHGLGGVPDVVKWKLVCTTINGNYAVGDEIDIGDVATLKSSGDFVYPAFAGGANATNVFLALDATDVTARYVVDKVSPGALVAFVVGSWSAKVCAVKYAS